MHSVKGFGIGNEAEVDVFLEFSCFVCDPTDIGYLISGSSAFLKPSLYFWMSLFGIGMKTNFFQSCGHCWVFQICWHIECGTVTASSFRIWSSQMEFHHLHLLFSQWCFLTHTWLHILSCWLQVSDYTIMIIWVLKIFFVQFFCIFLPPLLNVFCFC